MGLKEKRAVQKVQDGQAKYEEKLSEATGSNLTFDVNWDSFMENEKAIIMLPNGLFARLTKGLKKICNDDLGKEAIQGSLKKIVVEHVEDPADKSVKLEGDTLHISVALHNSSKGIFTDNDYSKIISGAL